MAESYSFDDNCQNPDVFPLLKCSKDTFAHLRNLSSSITNVAVPEVALILFRSGIFSLTGSNLRRQICTAHRDNLGLYWYRSSRTCSHPFHQNSKARPDRGLSAIMSKEIWHRLGKLVKVGEGN